MPALRALLLLRRTILAALIVMTAQTAFPQPQRQPILVESVNIAGNRLLTREEIFRHIKTRPGEPYDHEQVMRDLQALGNLRVFNRRNLRVITETGPRGGVEIFFEVQELPVIESVKFEGLRRGDEGALLEGLRRKGLEVGAGSVYELDNITGAVAAMKEMLRGRGWRRVEVETRVNQVSSTSVELTFVVSGRPPKKRPAPKNLNGPRRSDAMAALRLRLN